MLKTGAMRCSACKQVALEAQSIAHVDQRQGGQPTIASFLGPAAMPSPQGVVAAADGGAGETFLGGASGASAPAPVRPAGRSSTAQQGQQLVPARRPGAAVSTAVDRATKRARLVVPADDEGCLPGHDAEAAPLRLTELFELLASGQALPPGLAHVPDEERIVRLPD